MKPTNTNNIFVLKEFRATCGRKISDNIVYISKIYKNYDKNPFNLNQSRNIFNKETK